MKEFSLRMLRLFLLACFLFAAAKPVRAQSGVDVLENDAALDFPNNITFTLKFKPAGDVRRVDLLYGTEGKSCTGGLARQKVDFTTAGDTVTAEWVWDFHRTDSLPVGVKVDWKWEIVDSNGNAMVIDPKTMTIEDDSQNWKSVSGDGITIMWFDGSQSFGSKLLNIAKDSTRRLSEDAGIEPPPEILIVVYPDAEMLKEAVLFTSEWVGGMAFPNYSISMMGIAPGEDEWAAEVIPHELAHLITDVAVFNCLGTYMPAWLSEGLSTYLEGGNGAIDAASVEAALKKDDLFSLRSLAQGFAVSGDKARLAYAFSGEVVRYMIETYGAEKMTALLESIQQGNSIDAALSEVYGFDTDWLDLEYRASKGYAELPAVRVIPSPLPEATQVPTMALVKPGFGTVVTATPSPELAPETLADSSPTPVEAENKSTSGASSPLKCLGGNAAIFGLMLLLVSPALGKVSFRKKEGK